MMRPTPVTTIIGLTLALFAAVIPCSAAGIRLDLAPAAMVSGAQVRLGDVAVVRCDDADTAARLREIAIASAPMPGKSRPLDAQSIKVRLRQHGFDPDAVEAAWPERILVTRRGVIVPGWDLVAAGERALREQGPDDGETVITCPRTPADMVLPEGALELRANPLGNFAGTTRLVKVTAWVDGQAQSSQTICCQVRRFAQVVAASRPIARGAVIGADDVTSTRCEVRAPADELFADVAQVIGLRARRILRPGDLVARFAVEAPPVIERGQKVWVTVVCGAIRIQAEAIA
jgi:flagella basal body P-ring formation protein FlgA